MGSAPSGTLQVFIDIKKYVFFTTGSAPGTEGLRDLPADVFAKMSTVLTGDLFRYYRDNSVSDDACEKNGYSLDGESLDHQAAGTACFVAGPANDQRVKDLLDTMIPIFEQLATTQR